MFRQLNQKKENPPSHFPEPPPPPTPPPPITEEPPLVRNLIRNHSLYIFCKYILFSILCS